MPLTKLLPVLSTDVQNNRHNLPMLRFMEHAPVATINQPPELQGKIAVQMLTELIKPNSFMGKKERQFKNVVLRAELILEQEVLTK